MLHKSIQLYVIVQFALALVADFGHSVYFQPGRRLDFERLLKVKQSAREARVFIAHDAGDQGTTLEGFR